MGAACIANSEKEGKNKNKLTKTGTISKIEPIKQNDSKQNTENRDKETTSRKVNIDVVANVNPINNNQYTNSSLNNVNNPNVQNKINSDINIKQSMDIEDKKVSSMIKEIVISPKSNIDGNKSINFNATSGTKKSKASLIQQVNKSSKFQDKLKPDLKQIDDNYFYDNYHHDINNNKFSFEELIKDDSKIEIIEQQPLKFNKKKHDPLFNLMYSNLINLNYFYNLGNSML